MPIHTVQLAGSAQTIACKDGDTLLRAALRQGIGLPYECNSGGCGSCSFEPLEGEFEDAWPEAPGLAPAMRQRGRRLACQSIPRTEGSVSVRLRRDCIPAILPRRRTGKLMRVRSLTHDISEFYFQAEGDAEFLPGQYALLDIPGVRGSRGYSMSNLPNANGEWQFIIKRMPGGRATGVLFERLECGDTVELDGPYGMASLRTESAREVVCVAGGSGISPVLSILRAAVREPRLAGVELSLFYGGRAPRDICSTALIAADPLLLERVRAHAAISDLECVEDWVGARGFIHDVVEQGLEKPLREYEFYFCGPPPMTDAMQRLLLIKHKVPSAQLHFDRFF